MTDLEKCKDAQPQYSMKMWFIENNRLSDLIRLVETGEPAITNSVIYGLRVLSTQQPLVRKRLFSHDDYSAFIRNAFRETEVIPVLLKVLLFPNIDIATEDNIVMILHNIFDDLDNHVTSSKKQKIEIQQSSWKDCSNFGKFFNNALIPTDVHLIVEGQAIPCHRIVLAARSTYFEKLFTNGMEERHMESITIHDTCFSSVFKIIEYLYVGEIKIASNEEAIQLCTDANFFQLTELEQICGEFLVSNLECECIFAVWEVLLSVGLAKRRYFQEQCIIYLLGVWHDIVDLKAKVKILEDYFCRICNFAKQ